MRLEEEIFSAPGVAQVNAFEHEGKLGKWHGCRSSGVVVRWYLERAGFEPLVIQAVAATVPEQDLHPVAVAVEENEQMAGQRILPHGACRERRQTVETLAQVGRLQADKHLHGRRQREHGSLSRPKAGQHANGLAQKDRIARKRQGTSREPLGSVTSNS